MALGDITGDGAAELVVSLHSDALDGTWRVGIVHGGRRLAGTIDLSNPSNAVTLIDASATGNGGVLGIPGGGHCARKPRPPPLASPAHRPGPLLRVPASPAA